MVKENEKETAPKREERIRGQWQQNEIFKKSVEYREGANLLYFMKVHLLPMDCRMLGMH